MSCRRPVRGETTVPFWSRSGGAFLLPQRWHPVSRRALTIALCLLAAPALTDVAGTAGRAGEQVRTP